MQAKGISFLEPGDILVTNSKNWDVWERIYDGTENLEIEQNNYSKIKEILKSEGKIVNYD